jgi:glycosyltransferase involved in cell wall biosynthesis
MNKKNIDRHIIFFSVLRPWSMGDTKGAPSFFKTIQAYVSDWDVHLILMDNDGYDDTVINGIHMYPFKSFFSKWGHKKIIGLFARHIHARMSYLKMRWIGKKIIKRTGKNTVLYAYEVHGVKAAKELSVIYKLPLVTRFQGTVLKPVKDTKLNRIRRYPHFGALSEMADLTIMTNDGTQGMDVLTRIGNKSKKVLFWRNGVDIGDDHLRDRAKELSIRKKFDFHETDFVLLVVSRLARWKHVERSIDAVNNLVSSGVGDVKLLIVGDGQEMASLQERVEKYSLNSWVRFAGAVEQQNVCWYMDSADVFLSLYDLSNVGNPLLEAMASGKAIITSDVGDTSDVIQNGVNGILISPHELQILPEMILNLKCDPALAERLGKNAKNFAQKEFWSWRDRFDTEKQEVNQLLHTYEPYGNGK